MIDQILGLFGPNSRHERLVGMCKVTSLQTTVSNLGSAVTDLQGQNNWAVVDSSANVVRDSGSAAITAVKGSTGTYTVTFTKDVTGCAYTATIGDPGKAAPIPGLITVASGNNASDVQVQTFDKTGTAADAAFQLYVSCRK